MLEKGQNFSLTIEFLDSLYLNIRINLLRFWRTEFFTFCLSSQPATWHFGSEILYHRQLEHRLIFLDFLSCHHLITPPDKNQIVKCP